MAEVKQFRLPDVGEGLTEADIVTWRVAPGDKIEVNQVIVEIETAKAVVELPSPYEGVVTGLLVDEGVTVDVGTPIIAVDVSGGEGGRGDPGSGESAADSAITPAEVPAGAESPLQAAFEPGIQGSPAPKVERQAVLVGYGVKLGTTKRRQRKGGGARTPADGGSGAGAAQAASAAAPAEAPAVGPAPEPPS